MTENIKIALFSDVPPDPNYTGGQVLKRIIDSTKFADFDIYWLNQSHLPTAYTPTNNSKMAYTTTYELSQPLRFIKKSFGALPFLTNKIETLIKNTLSAINALLVGFRLAREIKKSNYNYVWLVVQGELISLTYLPIIVFCNKKVIFQQWDPISWWCTHRGHGRLWSKVLELVINFLEKKALLNLVPSLPWQQTLQSHGKKCHRIDNFLEPSELSNRPPPRTGQQNEIHAVFVGQFYSNNELVEIIDKLSAHSRAHNNQLFIHYFGGGQPELKSNNFTLINHGFVSKNELLSTIGQWDLALLPYPTDPKFRAASTLSFPSKSRIYLGAGLPILAYARLDSSPHKFYSREYRSQYINLLESSDIEQFIKNSCDRSSEATEIRYATSRTLVDKFFSELAELKPLHQFLLENISRI